MPATALLSPHVPNGDTAPPGATGRPAPWLELPPQPIEFRIRCEAEAEVLSRLLGLFAQLGLVPQRLNLERHDDKLHLALHLHGLSRHHAGEIAQQLRGLVCIWQVDWQALASND